MWGVGEGANKFMIEIHEEAHGKLHRIIMELSRKYHLHGIYYGIYYGIDLELPSTFGIGYIYSP